MNFTDGNVIQINGGVVNGGTRTITKKVTVLRNGGDCDDDDYREYIESSDANGNGQSLTFFINFIVNESDLKNLGGTTTVNGGKTSKYI